MITDELREWAYARFSGGFSSEMEREVDEIADRIDAAHRSALEKVASMVDGPSKLDELDRAVAILEQHDIGNALRISELRERVGAIERKLNHRGGNE